ncbi:immunity protein [Pectobacterium odoriferum]|uniref:Immunity protein n=1 Tax=Pectobacterium odoriferum TaxID=78398 RepID=A0ABD6VR47_9GAMM|nr:immunity protein [Pectobacterium odoriferum]POD96002.1 immunity protein [Pectobacterium odoriferum]POE12538.1 immunity protein [Pectobacterium odoriferum]POE26272.1 immunity protein [Pectobacterium odoriferum]POE30698.1 immunity protein [Pectobacterium odoriferum]POE35978.1 immunity protein [Pectobacterium odoriferum]
MISLKSLLILLIGCSLTMILVVFSACLCAAFLVYLKSGVFILSWHGDVIFSLKRGAVVGITTGAGIWLMSWLKANKDK